MTKTAFDEISAVAVIHTYIHDVEKVLPKYFVQYIGKVLGFFRKGIKSLKRKNIQSLFVS